MTDIDTRALDRELKKSSAELLILSHRNRVLASHIKAWETFVEAVRRITGAQHA